MGIEAKHAYRFGYLKSEQWRDVRIEALAREGGKCQICGLENIHNDAHHIWYPENIYQTTQEHLVILCRPCHDFIHSMMPKCKTSDEEEGREMWMKFSNAVKMWRLDHLEYFGGGEIALNFGACKAMRKRIEELRVELWEAKTGIIEGFDERKIDVESLDFIAMLQNKLANYMKKRGRGPKLPEETQDE